MNILASHTLKCFAPDLFTRHLYVTILYNLFLLLYMLCYCSINDANYDCFSQIIP